MKNELLDLSSDLNVITAEINSYKSIAGQAIFEIGRRLKNVKENPDKYGLNETNFKTWCSEKLDFTRQTADRMIQSYEQFGRHDVVLPSSKIFEMLSLPESVDRQEFIEQKHTIPSTGEEKTVDEMTVRELREVKKALKEAETKAEQAQKSEEIALRQLKEAEEDKHRLGQLLTEERNKEPKVITKEVVVEVDTEELEQQVKAKEQEISSLKSELNMLKKKQTFNEAESEKEIKYLNYEASKTVLSLKLQIEEFLKEVAITAFRKGAIAASSEGTKRKLEEGIEELEDFCAEMRLALNGRIDLSKQGG
ncbi:DUF3102 domain-containing protein [Bacillus badius]|uniref:DUF3102 domain-containing protein n=1 Tax=Bacillus badius TaxID=1455 RepID=UPI001CBF08EB|nr:DUF3102 domain-containing protein [Bacillus badius]UAT29460.1 DUF3102 domain-containing protein [Bacillus badius]